MTFDICVYKLYSIHNSIVRLDLSNIIYMKTLRNRKVENLKIKQLIRYNEVSLINYESECFKLNFNDKKKIP